MDGFLQGSTPRGPTRSSTRSSMPNYWHWARQNVLFDNFFASAQGPRSRTTCSRSPRPRAAPTTTPAGRPSSRTAPTRSGATRRRRRRRVRQRGRLRKVPPCFDFLTEGDLLNRARSWAYYAASRDQKGYIWSAYAAMRRYRMHEERWQRHVFSVDDVVNDIREACCRRSRGSRPSSSCPSTPSTTSATARTGPRR